MGLLALNLPVIGQSSATEDQKIRDALAAVQTGVNGNLDEANVPNMAAAFTTYKVVTVGGSSFGAQSGTLLFPGPMGQAVGALAPGAANSANLAFYLDPLDFLANTRATKLRLRVMLVTNAVAPAVNFTFGLYPVATWGGASGASPTIATVGTVVAGSTVAFTTPTAATALATTGTDFNFPAAAPYVFGVALSGAMAAGSLITFNLHLEMRQV